MTLLKIETAIPLLSKQYKDGRLIPFIGSGFSKPLGIPTCDDLIKSIADKMDFEGDLFLIHGSFAQLAEFVKQENQQVWKEWIYRMTVEFNSDETIKKRKESISHKALTSLKWHTIYTTNYDTHLEGALEDAGVKYMALASLADFLKPRTPDACEIIKFHGTLQDAETIILTESNFFDRMELESAPDQRLRCDILSNSFMFIGYSFNDPNIRYIWYKIHKLRRSQRNGNSIVLRPSFLISFGANPVQPILLDKWKINVITLDPRDKSQSIADLLNSLK